MIRLRPESADAWGEFRAVIAKDNPDFRVSDTSVLSICIEIALATIDRGHIERSAYFKEIPADPETVERVKKQMDDLAIRLEAQAATLESLGAMLHKRDKPETQDNEDISKAINRDEPGPGKIEWPCGM